MIHYHLTLMYKGLQDRNIYQTIHFKMQLKLCATFSANVNINYRLPIKVYYRICTLRHIRIEINHGSQNVFWVLTLIRYILLYSDARFLNRGCCGCDRMDLKLSMQSVPITTNICEFESCSGEVYSIQRLRNKSWKQKA
jgi:hypothetical protein